MRGPIRELSFVLIALLILAGLLLVLRSTISNALRQHSRNLSNASTRVKLPAAAVVVGKPLKWRTLHQQLTFRRSDEGVMGTLLPIQYERKPALLLVQSKKSLIFDHKGKIGGKPFTAKNEYFHDLFAWDADGDGTDELVANHDDYFDTFREGSFNVRDSTEILRLDGSELKTLKGVNSQIGNFTPRDYDGDGLAEIVLRDNHEGGDFLIYGPRGLLASQKPIEIGPDYFLGDLDGSGHVSIFQNKAGTHSYVSLPDPARVVFSKPKGPRLGEYDLNSDGRLELILLTGIYSPASNDFNRFAYPAKLKGDSGYSRHFAVGRFLDSNLTVAMTVCQEKYGSSAVCIFAANGNCLYYEEFGQTIWNVVKLQSKAGDHLVVQLSDQLLIFP